MAHSLDRDGERSPYAAALGSDRTANASSDGFEPSAATSPTKTAKTGRTDRQAPRGRAAPVPAQTDRTSRGPTSLPPRHMPREPRKFSIPRKTKEKKALLRHVSITAREHEDMMNILTSSYIDSASTGCFTYFKPQVVYNELLEKEFVEKRKEMKADGRTEKELEESYCFLLTDAAKAHSLCENGLLVRQSWMTGLGDPAKGVYLSRYSDLLQVNPITPGASGEIVIFKVMKGKVKSISENMKSLLDPTPHFDSHVSTSASKVNSLTSYRALEFTQQYFYEYTFDELRRRPRQVCPYGVISFTFKRKDALPTMPGLPIRVKSVSAERSKKRASYMVWTGDLVKGDRVLCQISLCSFLAPFLPHKLPEKLEIGQLMRLDELTKLLPSDLFLYSRYSNSYEAEKNGFYGSLLEVTKSSWSTTLLNKLEMAGLVLVTLMSDRGFVIMLSSSQMATPTERGEGWKRCLQALFVFPESRRLIKSGCNPPPCDASESMPGCSIMPQLDSFIPSLTHALVKAKASAPSDLSTFVAHHARDYVVGLNDSRVHPYPMDKYDTKMDEQEMLPPPSKYHKGNIDGSLKTYMSNTVVYQLSVAQARSIMETPVVSQDEFCSSQLQQLTDLVLSFHRNAKQELKREGGGRTMQVMTPGWNQQLEPEAERTLKVQKMSQDARSHCKIPGLAQAIGASGNHSEVHEGCQRESSQFDRLAIKFDLTTSLPPDLKKQEQLEAADSVISSEGFSPGSHSGEINHQRAAWRVGGYEDEEDEGEIPWFLIPITGVCSERYTQRDRNIPQDPRFQHLATSIGTINQRSWKSPTPPLDPSSPYSPSHCPSPKSHLSSSSPSQCLPPEAPDSLKFNRFVKDLHDANKEPLAVSASRETAELNVDEKNMDCPTGAVDTAAAACGRALPALSPTPMAQIEASLSSQQVTTPPSVSSATALSSLTSLWQPEISRESVCFYLHSSEPKDLDFEALKEHLLSEGYVEQCPLEFLISSHPGTKMVVLIHTNHVEEQIHEVPGLVQLKQRESVKFLGIDSLESFRNGIHKELFVSGGVIIPDDDVLNPDVITYDQLAALLTFLEEQCSRKSMWNLKVHCRCLKKLQKQARFSTDAANLLDLLSAYEKRHIIQFLSCDLCDRLNHQSSSQCSLKELHECFTQYRHTLYLTEHPYDKFPADFKVGVVVTNVEDVLQNIKSLIGFPDIQDLKQILDGVLSSKEHDHSLPSQGHDRQPSPSLLPGPPSNRPSSSSGPHSCETSGSAERHPTSQHELNSVHATERASQDSRPHGAHSAERHPVSRQNHHQVHSTERTSQDPRGHHSAREFPSSRNELHSAHSEWEPQAHRPRGAYSAERFSASRQELHQVRPAERESQGYRSRAERFSGSQLEHHPVHSEWESQGYRHHGAHCADGFPANRQEHHLALSAEWESQGYRPHGAHSAKRFSGSQQELHPSRYVERESLGPRLRGAHSDERFSGSCHELHPAHSAERTSAGPRPRGAHSAERFSGSRQELNPSRSAERASPVPRLHGAHSAERFSSGREDHHSVHSTERAAQGPRPRGAPSSERYSRHEPRPLHSAERASPDLWHRGAHSPEWYPASRQERHPVHSVERVSLGPWHHGAHSQERYPASRQEHHPVRAAERVFLGHRPYEPTLRRDFHPDNSNFIQSRPHRAQSPVGPNLLRGFPLVKKNVIRSMPLRGHYRALDPEGPPC